MKTSTRWVIPNCIPSRPEEDLRQDIVWIRVSGAVVKDRFTKEDDETLKRPCWIPAFARMTGEELCLREGSIWVTDKNVCPTEQAGAKTAPLREEAIWVTDKNVCPTGHAGAKTAPLREESICVTDRNVCPTT